MLLLRWHIVALLCSLLLSVSSAQEPVTQHVLILVEGGGDERSPAVGDGRQLANLLGHFRTRVELRGVDGYVPGLMGRFDRTFYIGFSAGNTVPRPFLEDVMASRRPLVWIHTGFAEFSLHFDVARRFGFSVSGIDSSGTYVRVTAGERSFTKEEPNINVVRIVDRTRVQVLATAGPGGSAGPLPYMVQSESLLYVADSPFALAGPTDRYLLFADMLHEILGEQHQESHEAIIRIEDVNPMENPGKLRDIADLLSGRGIPFLVGVTPIYVDPGQGVRVTLSERPEVVDALTYMVANGGTIVMHGVTHQYKGVTASDYEFWDESTNGPIRGETDEAIARKIEMGIEEFMKNGLYPLLWETPHYAASRRLYSQIGRFFSAAVEQRLVIENSDYSQFFPYVIQRDWYGQTVYPENLGFVPLELQGQELDAYLQSVLEGARTGLQVRDGYASHFFHAFVDLHALETLVDGIEKLGYTYVDLREKALSCRLHDRVILTGSQSYALELHDQFLRESYFNAAGEPVRTVTSPERITGRVVRSVSLAPQEFFVAAPSEISERPRSLFEGLVRDVSGLFKQSFGEPDSWSEARPMILWNHFARGGAYNDQAALAGVFRSVGIPLDTLFVGQLVHPRNANLLIVPYAFVDSLRPEEFDVLVRFVEAGGSLITDAQNDLATEFGVRFGTSAIAVRKVQDHLFPEERVTWQVPDQLTRFSCDNTDMVFCSEEETGAPLVVGTRWGSGRVLFIGTRFDPHSMYGISRYPFLLEYVRRYFALGPVIRRDNLELYFDPGFRHNQSIEHLVSLWTLQGVRRIHAAAWHRYPKYTYDYDRLIRLAHANGILVYAWFEPPQVSLKFWLEHPEWREKNLAGEDVRPSWRYPVAMTDTACLSAMTAEYLSLLLAHDWDGANLAELYFEAGKGFSQPTLWSPMHPSAITRFRRQYGFDLRDVFDARSPRYWKSNPGARESAVRFRVHQLEEVYHRLLGTLAGVAGGKEGFDIVVTAMDSRGSPELREQIGVDMSSILALQRRYHFTLQVEDPEHRWSTAPDRYARMGESYAGAIQDPGRIMLDLNILAFRKPDLPTPFATLIPTGTECYHLIRSAATGSDRFTIYAESSVNPQDMLFAPFAAAARVNYTYSGNDILIDSPVSFTLDLPLSIDDVVIDGVPEAAGRGHRFLIPAGRHTVWMSKGSGRALSDHQLLPRLLSLTGEVLSCVTNARAIDFTYHSTTRTLASFDREPVQIDIDGRQTRVEPMRGNDCFTIFLPPGRHSVHVVAGDLFTYGVSLTSFWSSTGIALFGLAGGLILGIMYVVWIIVRARRVAFGGRRNG